ncbi:hypothetical protein BLX88_06335, partial [Bacillus obstructivus]
MPVGWMPETTRICLFLGGLGGGGAAPPHQRLQVRDAISTGDETGHAIDRAACADQYAKRGITHDQRATEIGG